MISTVLYLYDLELSDEEILARVEEKLNADFRTCITAYSKEGAGVPVASLESCHACEMIYAKSGRLKTWNNQEYLATQKFVNLLKDLPDSVIVRLENRAYYQIRTQLGDSISVVLIPLHITYQAQNNFLIPYIFLGRWEETLSGDKKWEYLNSMQVAIGETTFPGSQNIRLTDDVGNTILSYGNVPVIPFRAPVRYMVLLFLILGGLLLCVFLRVYSLDRWDYRYFINGSLFVGVILVRMILYAIELPGNYIDAGLFSPDILAFHFLAPSLGEMTINIFTLAILVWVAYMHFFRINIFLYRKLFRKKTVAWLSMAGTITISSLLLKLYVEIFRRITINSQVDIEFSNFFKADIYSFLILLDVGILFLSACLIIFTLLKLNVLYIQKFKLKKNKDLLLFHILTALLINFLLHPTAPILAFIFAIAILGLGITVYRVPSRPILHQDLLNYLIMTAIFSVVVTQSVVIGVNLSNEQKADQIAERVLGNQVSNTVFAFTKSQSAINDRLEEVIKKKQEFEETREFKNWVKETFLSPNFKEFEVRLYLYDQQKNRVDEDRDIVAPSFGPDADIPIEVRGEKIEENFYQLPNYENKYLDLYVGWFDLELDTTGAIRFLMELSPDSRGTEGIYPALSLDQGVYEDRKLINSFDHAIYRDGSLYNESSQTPFPIYLEDYKNITSRFTRIREGQKELVKPIGNNKIVVVRYTEQSFIDILTTFSFIFYFYIIGAATLIAIPVLALRSLRSGQFAYSIPLRAKIRFGLFAISIFPLLLIVILLSYFVRSRYNDDAKKELRNETARITQLIEQDYQNLHKDPFSRLTLLREFQDKIQELEPKVRNDISVFDEYGKRIASTQPMIFEAGISSDLMNEVAFDSLRRGQLSDLVIREKVGNLEFFSGYRPVIGVNDLPIGYVNVPYLSKQDQLDEQVTDFLAYLANIYLLVFLLINVAAVVVSGTITRPLSMIQQKLSSLSLGNVNDKISYDAKDEIGSIVNAYNDLVTKLVESEEKISQNQREMAWRQMARQVAHEIKNPLTPMKLSIQHLVRSWEEKTDRLESMFPKVMKTLLVQIDSMVRIANSFSEFAKMPEPVKSKVLINDILLEVIDLYTQSEEAIWLIDVPSEPFWVSADRDQLSRCFNNIIKNGIQSLEGSNGIIHISMRILGNTARIEIKDNGKGIPQDIQKKIFEPSFSTKSSGMGLGLAIVKRIVENTNGQVYFESVLGEGTTFFIEIPIAENGGTEE
ncbi:MAG: ATP-binding protein [Bacteroidia bacterium]|nr:ATP-binding protein [Bacteroidia bacterium]